MPNKTDYKRIMSGNDPNITLVDKHDLTCKTRNGSENASNKTLLDNQESTDNNNPYKAKQVTTYNPKCLSDNASIKTMLDNQDSQGNTTSGAGKPEPKTHNHSLIIIDNTTYASGKAPNNTSSDTQASNASRNCMPMHSDTSSKGNILNENNPSTLSNSQSTSINEDHCYSALCHPKRKKLTLQIYQQRLLPSCQQNMHINALNLKISHCCYLLVCYLCCINNKDKRIILHCFLSCLQSSLEWLRISFPQFLQRGAFLLDLYGLLI